MSIFPTVCPFCGAGCRLGLRVMDGKVVGLEYLPDHPVAGGALCSKGNAALEVLDHPQRLRHPMVRQDGGWREIGWEEALGLLTARLEDIRQRRGASALAFLASAKATNEENYLFQKLARLLGSPHVDHCARLCHSPSVVGLSRALGSGAMTNPIPDLLHSRCILILGSNFAENHPVVSRWVCEARERGAAVFVADPRRTPTAGLADRYLPIRPGTDVALLNGLMRAILDEGLGNWEFVRHRTVGFEEWRASLQGITVEDCAAIAGVTAADIVAVARAYARAEAAAIVYCMGITQHTVGSDNVEACANLALLCGQIGRPGAGILPLRGQNNVQGACDMGALVEFLPGYAPIADPQARRRVAQAWGREDLPEGPGLSVVEIMDAAREGRVKGMVVMGENPAVSDPTTAATLQALERLEFLVVQDLFLTETAQRAHLVLPAACWAEKSGSYTNTERRVQWSEKVVEPPGEARSDLWIIGEVGRRLGVWAAAPTAEEVLTEVGRVAPIYGGITAERLRRSPAGLFWPCPDAAHPGTPILHRERFSTADGKGRFFPVAHRMPGEQPAAEFPLWMTTGRVTVHYNSGAMTRRALSLSRYAPEVWVALHPQDAERLGLADGDEVEVRTPRGQVAARVQISQEVQPGLVFLPFHFPGVNALTRADLDPRARIPAYKVAACALEKGG